jgi:hypothetical protein
LSRGRGFLGHVPWSCRSSSLRPTPPQINEPKSQECRAQERRHGARCVKMDRRTSLDRFQANCKWEISAWVNIICLAGTG